MPIYEYRCTSCGATFEAIIIRRSDEAEVVCDKCGATQVERLLSACASISSSGGATGGGCSPRGGFS